MRFAFRTLDSANGSERFLDWRFSLSFNITPFSYTFVMIPKNSSKIELNAYGPYNHGVWKNEKTGINVGKEEFLQGRSQFIFDKFQEFMSNFSKQEISQMSLIDVGSYDGWFANEIEKFFNFKRIISSEPRLKNIEKGKEVRKFLGLETNFEIRNEKFEDIQESYDIVVCIGVLHHVDSVSRAIKKLSSICDVGIFLETQIYEPPKFMMSKYFGKRFFERHNSRIIEPKDVVYLTKDANLPSVAISGHKYESSYFDGSSDASQVVELPSTDGLRLNLAANGFVSTKIHTSTKEYGKRLTNKNFRVYKATILSAVKSKDLGGLFSLNVKDSVQTYEQEQFLNILSETTIMRLKRKQKISCRYEVVLRAFAKLDKFSIKNDYIYFLKENICKLFKIQLHEISILKLLKYDFKNKLGFEVAKFELSRGNVKKAEDALQSVVSSDLADWRSTYRSLFLLYLVEKAKNSGIEEFYLSLLKKSNRNFPLTIEPLVRDRLGLHSFKIQENL